MRDKLSYTFDETPYSWKNMSLYDFLLEGNTPSSWKQFFLNNQDILFTISEKLEEEKHNNKNLIIYPSIHKTFRSFIPIEKIKVVVLGQDPYHSGTTEFDGSAVGYCFSVLPGNSINPSLKNIYKELRQEGYTVKEDGILTHWAKQGCFLLNTALTVEKGCPDSHTSIWYDFTENAVKYIEQNYKNIVWLLLGSKAHKYKNFIDENNHHIICTSHPSPFSFMRSSGNIPAFLGSNIFKHTNDYLTKKNMLPINW